MKVRFLYSKIKEKEKLLNIYKEYQWFIDNNFSIILPRFFDKVYKQSKNNKIIFAKDISKELDKSYYASDYKIKLEKIKNNWSKVEHDFFDIFNNLNFKIKKEYLCYVSLYGPQGQFKYPNSISLCYNLNKTSKEANKTIAHELIHLLILNRAKKLKLKNNQIEAIVDCFFVKTELKEIFPKYKIQKTYAVNEHIFNKLLGAKYK